MSDPNSTSPDILSDSPVKDILRPGKQPLENQLPMYQGRIQTDANDANASVKIEKSCI
jgi:hypothetical protein